MDTCRSATRRWCSCLSATTPPRRR
jgi:hypothetical protein